MITINKRITYDNRRKIQEAARLRLWDSPAVARAGRPLRRGTGVHHQLATGAELRHLHAAAAGPDGRRASRGGVRNGCYHSDQGAKVHRSQKEVQGSGLINRGLRAPSPHTTNAQALKRQGSSTQAAGAQAPRGSRAQGRRRASHGSQAPGPWILDKVSWLSARGSQSR